MSVSRKRLVIAIILSIICSSYLNTFAHKKGKLTRGASTGAYTWFVNMLNLQQLVVGFLWMEFDRDCLNAIANYHRQLITLDAITALDSSDFAAWSLKCYMRLDQSIKKKHKDMKTRALKDYELACELNPNDYRYPEDAAEAIFFKLKDYKLTMKYLQQAEKLSKHSMKTDKLFSYIYEKEGKISKAISYQKKILARTDVSEGDRNTARRRIKEMEAKIKSDAN